MMENTVKHSKTLKPSQIVVLGFAALIIIGALLLMLPISSVGNTSPSFINALFTSTSAVCVTGLVVLDTGTYWSVFGQVVILLLIQIGGLGFMTMATSLAMALGKKISLRNRLIMQESLNQFSISGVLRLTRYVVFSTLFIEGIGAVILSFRFVPDYGWIRGIFFGIFHSISAFCNAGFDLIGNFSSFTGYVSDPLVNVIIPILVILGGLGFFVYADLMSFRGVKKLSLHTKLVLLTTLFLLVGSFVLFFVFEVNNPATLGQNDLGKVVAGSFFQSMTPRTAGFNTLDIAQLTKPSKVLTLLLMFIGGSPGSTAGGIKTTTFALMILYLISTIQGKQDVEFAHRRINKNVFAKALTIFLLAVFFLGIMILLLTIFEHEHSFEEIVFEAVSAFGTVGLSEGITPFLSSPGKILIMILMFLGRLGPLTVVIAISNQTRKNLIRYPEERIIVG